MEGREDGDKVRGDTHLIFQSFPFTVVAGRVQNANQIVSTPFPVSLILLNLKGNRFRKRKGVKLWVERSVITQ